MSIIIKGSDNFQSVCSIFFNRRIKVWNYNIDCTCLSHLYGKILRSLGFYLVRKTLYYPISLGNFKFGKGDRKEDAFENSETERI